MKASSVLSTLVVLVFVISVASGTRYTVSFQGLVGRLCGSNAPSGCPDSPPPYVSGSPLPYSPSSSSLPIGASYSPSPSGYPFGTTPSATPYYGSATATATFGSSATASPSYGSTGSLGGTATASATSYYGYTATATATIGSSASASGSFGASFSPYYPSATSTATTGSSATASASYGSTGSLGGTATASATSYYGYTATATATIGSSASASGSFGASFSPYYPSGTSTPGSSSGSSSYPSSCPVAPSCSVAPSCTPCFCATPSSFPSFSRPPSSTPTPSPTSAASFSTSPTRSFSASLTATPSPNPCGPQYEAATTSTFNVGLLFDRSTWAKANANPAVYGTLYAINQINAAGGISINGKNISLNPVIYDTQGTPNGTVAGANSLIHGSCVSVIIGTETGAERRAVESMVLDSTAPSNAAPGLLLNPFNNEGADVDAGVINFGANLLTNTRHAIDWAVANGKYHIHLLGSDDVDSRIINTYARQYITSTYPSVLIIGENYMPVGASEYTAQQTFLAPLYIGSALFDNAVGHNCSNGTACTLLLSSVFGQAANRILYSALAARYLTPTNPNMPYVVMALQNDQYQFLNFSLTNVNNQLMGTNYLDGVDAVQNGNVASWKSGLISFIQNAALLNDSYYNVTTGTELRAYNAIRLWANAVAASGTSNPSVLRSSIANATFNAPNGLISVNATTREATTATTPFYVSRLNTPPLQGLTVTVLATYSDSFQPYAPAVGNLTSPDSYSSLINGIHQYYLSGTQTVGYQQTSTQLAISLGWELPAIPAPTS